MDANELISRCKEHLRLMENYYIPEKIRLEKVDSFLKTVITFEYNHIQLLNQTLQSVFDVLCKDLIRQAELFMNSKERSIMDAKNLLNLILSIESYFRDVEKLEWVLGRKISAIEKLRIRRIFRKNLHQLYDKKNKRTVRGTRVKIIITGSLAKGKSDWKMINGGDIPKPSDYDIPREYRKISKAIYKKLDEELVIPQQLKPKMSDVDILIMNEVIFDSISKDYSYKGWSFRLGEKYDTGIGASDILEKIHQALSGTKIGGIRGRWVNYIVVRDEEGYNRYMAERMQAIEKVQGKTGKEIDVKDVLILDEIIN